MVVSWYVTTNRRLADPSKHGRLYRQLSPFFSDAFTKGFKQPKFGKMLERTITYADDDQITAGIQLYETYHQELLKDLNKLKGKRVVFLPGITIDRGDENPAYLGVDYACPRNLLTEKILFTVQDIHRAFGYDSFDDVHFIQVQPLVLPFHVTAEQGDCRLVHSLDDVVARTNEDIHPRTFGTTVRDPRDDGFRQGIYQYSRTLLDSHVAKEAHGETLLAHARKYHEHVHHGGPGLTEHKLDDLVRWFGSKRNVLNATRERVHRLIEKDVQFNIQLMAAAYARVITELGVDTVHYFAARSSPERTILEYAAAIADVPLDTWRVMRNAKMSRFKEADEGAIRLLQGKLYRWHVEKKGHLRQRAPFSPVIEREPQFHRCIECPNLKNYRCSFAGQKLEDIARKDEPGYTPSVKNCACDFASNRFTVTDVEAMLRAKYGHKLLADPQEVFRELQFKKIQYREEDGSIHTASERDIWQEDMSLQGWTSNAIWDDLAIKSDAFIVKIGDQGERDTQSWRQFIGDPKLQRRRGIVVEAGSVAPLVVPAERPERYSLRPSEFSSACLIGRILSKVDTRKVLEKTGVHIIPHKWSISGTRRHHLGLERPWVDYMGRNEHAVPVWDYTERELWSTFQNMEPAQGSLREITVFGHADGMAQVLGPRRMPIVFDYKRSPNEKPSYTIQLMLYWLGMERAMQTRYDEAVLWLVNRPHFGNPGERHVPVHHYAYADRSSRESIWFDEFDPWTQKWTTVKGLEDLVVRSYNLQHSLVADKAGYLSTRQLCAESVCCGKAPNGSCQHPFNSQLCNLMHGLVEKGENVKDYFYDGVVL